MSLGASLIAIVALVGCGLMIAVLIGVAWALSSNRKPPSGH